MKSTCGHEDDKLVLCCTHWFKVEEEEETFVILMAQYNISYSCSNTLMKLIKGSFHRPPPSKNLAKTTNRWVTKSSVSNKEMQALVCCCVTDLSFLHQLCSFTPFTPLLNPPFLLFVLSFSWWAQYHMERNTVNLGLPSWQDPLSASCHSHFWGRGKKGNFDSQGGKWNLLDSLPPPSRRPQAGGARGWQGAPPVQWTQPDKRGAPHRVVSSARTAPVKKEKGEMFAVIVFVCASKHYSCWGSAGQEVAEHLSAKG